MSFAAETFHLLRKELRRTRHASRLYLLLLAVTAPAAAGALPHAEATASLGGVLIGLFAAGLLAYVVQADSPLRVDAFWATLPIRPLALLASRGIYAIAVLLAPALLAQAAVFLAFDVAALDLAPLLTASVVRMGVWLLLAGLVAALTRSLRSFALAILALVVGTSAVGGLVRSAAAIVASDPIAGPVEAPVLLLGAIGIAAVVTLIVWTYRSGRQAGWRIWLVAVPAIVCATYASALSGAVLRGWTPPTDRYSTNETADGEKRGQTRLTRLIVGPFTSGRSNDRATIAVRLRTPPDERGRYRVTSPRVELVLPDGSAQAVEVYDEQLGDLPLPDDGLRRRGRPRRTAASDVTPFRIRFFVDETQRETIARGGVVIRLRATLHVLEADRLLDLPLREGATANLPGRRFSLVSVELSSQSADFDLRQTTVSNVRYPLTSDAGVVRAEDEEELHALALVHDRRAEILSVRDRGSHASPATLVLPGTRAVSNVQSLQAGPRPLYDTRGGAPDVDVLPPGWFDDARLVLYRWRSAVELPWAIEQPIPPL